MNRREGFPPGVGSPATRMFDREVRATLPSLPCPPASAQELRAKLAASRDKAQGRKHNTRAIEFQVGETCLLWDHREHRFSHQCSILAPNRGLDGASRSYWVEDDGGKQKLVHCSWLIKLPEAAAPAPAPAATQPPAPV